MSVLATDTFNRADSSVLGSNWTTISGNAAHHILSNQALSPDDPSADYYNAVVWPNDQYSQAIMVNAGDAALGEDNGPGLCVRAAAAANTMYFAMFNNHGIDLYSVVASSYANIGNYDTAQANNDVGYLEAQGTAIKCKQNGTQRISVTDSSIASGRAGLFGANEPSVNPLMDSWEGGDFTGGGGMSSRPPVQAWFNGRGH